MCKGKLASFWGSQSSDKASLGLGLQLSSQTIESKELVRGCGRTLAVAPEDAGGRAIDRGLLAQHSPWRNTSESSLSASVTRR